MNFEQIISSLEKLLYRIIIEIILLFVTVKKVLSNTKNSYTIVAAEESNPEEESRYQNISSPVKFAIVIALASVFAVQQMTKLDERAAQSQQEELAITDTNASDTTASTAVSDSAIQEVNPTVKNDIPIEEKQVEDGLSSFVHGGEGRANQLRGDILQSIEELDITEQAVFFFFSSNMDAILIALLLGRMLKQNFPGQVFRSSMFSIIYAKCYLTLPLLLMLLSMIFIPDITPENENSPLTIFEGVMLLSALLFIIGHYFFLKASYHILQQFIPEKKWWVKLSILVLAVTLDYSWILLLI